MLRILDYSIQIVSVYYEVTKQSPAEAMKKSFGSALKPTVPGPRLSAKTLTSENAPDIMPKPSPTTKIKFK